MPCRTLPCPILRWGALRWGALRWGGRVLESPPGACPTLASTLHVRSCRLGLWKGVFVTEWSLVMSVGAGCGRGVWCHRMRPGSTLCICHHHPRQAPACPVVLHIAPCQAFDKLLTGINDIVENRIESNLRTVSKVLIVNFSNSGSFTPETFVRDNTPSVAASTALLQVLFGRAHVHCIGPRYPAVRLPCVSPCSAAVCTTPNLWHALVDFGTRMRTR